jgi:lysophospholipase L1-like esterase
MSVAIRAATRIQDMDDINVTLGAGVDEYALVYDHDTAKFVLRAPAAPFAGILATGATVGATAQAQAFTNGVTIPATAGLNTIAAKRLHAVYCVGDSITDTTEVSALNALLGAAWVARDLGVPGNQTSLMVARFTAEVINPGDAEYVVILGGINDVSAGYDAATIESRLQTMYTAAHNAGIKVVALTITPFKGVTWWDAGKQTIVETVNTWIRASANYVDYVIDTYAALEDPATADTLLPAYDSGDHLHPSTAGSQAIAAAIYAGTTWTASSALATLDVSGTPSLNQSLLSTDSPSFVALTLRNALAAKSLVVNESGEDFDTRFEGDTDPNLLFLNAGTDRVGIGTDAPYAKLEIVDGNILLGNTHKIQWWNATDGYIKSIIEVDSGDNLLLRSAHAAGDVNIGTASGTLIQVQSFQTTISNPLVVNEAGGDVDVRIEGDTDEYLFCTDASTDRVGIKTAVPATALHVVGAATVTGGIRPAADSTTALQLQNVAGTSVLNVDTTNSRVGIGTSAPGVQLEVQSDTDGAVAILRSPKASGDSTGISKLGLYFGNHGAAGVAAVKETVNTVGLAFYTEYGFNAESEKMRIQSSGNVGIGTTAPVTILHAISTTATTNALRNVLTLGANVTGAGVGAGGLGAGLLFTMETTTTADTSAASVQAIIYEATHATRKFDLVGNAYDTAIREGWRVRGNGSAPAIGFLGAVPQARIAHVADPAGGATVDAEARSAINSILSTLELFGLHAAS